MADVRAAAEQDGVSLNGFIVQAVAEKVAALRARGLLRELTPEEQAAFLEARAAHARPGRYEELLARAGTSEAALPGDEVPEGWLAGDDPGEGAAPEGTARQRTRA
jgi:hypothetical protein